MENFEQVVVAHSGEQQYRSTEEKQEITEEAGRAIIAQNDNVHKARAWGVLRFCVDVC